MHSFRCYVLSQVGIQETVMRRVVHQFVYNLQSYADLMRECARSTDMLGYVVCGIAAEWH